MKGQLAVSKVELRALELGIIPSRPLFDTRYDLILDDFKKLIRVQVKYANGTPSKSTGSVIVKLEYEDRVGGSFSYQENEVDALIVYIPLIDKLCLFPPKLFTGKKKMYIRLEDSRNNQKRGIIRVQDYLW